MVPASTLRRSASSEEGDVPGLGSSRVRPHGSGDDDERLRRMLEAHFHFVWRLLRRLGVEPGAVDDAAQQVFMVASDKLDRIEVGKEKAYLTGTASRVAANVRRARRHRGEVADDGVQTPSASPSAEQLLDQKQRRRLLDEVLDAMPQELRTVLVLFELEELTTPQVAELLGIPTGTVASRVRRARQVFESEVELVRVRYGLQGASDG